MSNLSEALQCRNQEDVTKLKTLYPILAQFNDITVSKIWSHYSDSMCATWLIVQDKQAPMFLEWLEMEIEYSGRYQILMDWALWKERLFNKIEKEKDVEILKGVRQFCVEAASKCYEQIGRLDAAAKQAALFVDNEIEAGRVSGAFEQPRVDVNPAPRNLRVSGLEHSNIPEPEEPFF